MQMQSFEIRVALLGYVSAGKSTVLNALLQNKCSEVAMRRTTAGVNLFRVYSKGASSNTTEASDKASWNPDPEVVHTPTQVLSQITSDNKELRSVNRVKETVFNIELDKPICDMRQDTTLVLMDIPGLNEAGSKAMFSDYVESKWDTFDCVIVVMDVLQGVNTEEQVKLLEMVQEISERMKDVPVIVLCNKVDDPDNKEIIGLVGEISEKVYSIFDESTAVHFVPISAENAFVYRTASRLSFEEFKLLDESLIDRIVHEEFGKAKWRKLSVAERYQTAYAAISNPSSLEDSLAVTNFHAFLEIFRHCVGESAQPALIQKQCEVALEELTLNDGVVAEKLQKIHDVESWLGVPLLDHSKHFWKIYNKFHRAPYFFEYASCLERRYLQKMMSQLIAYGTFLKNIGSTDEKEMMQVVDVMASLVSKQVRWIVEHAETSVWLDQSYLATDPLYDWDADLETWVDATSPDTHVPHSDINTPPANNPHHWERTVDGWTNIYTGVEYPGNRNPVLGKISWASLSSFDFCTMAQSILLLSYSKCFNNRLGQEKVALEKIVSDFAVLPKTLETEHLMYKEVIGGTYRHSRMCTVLTEFTKCTYNDQDELVPKYPDKYALVAQIAQPKLLSDPDHWGHLAWQFCEFVDGSSTNGDTKVA